MTPDEFLRSVSKQPLAPAYLLLGQEAWHRQQIRDALIERALPPEDRENGFTRYDLDETDLNVVMDDARSFSLFAANRLIWVSSAEGALPRTRSSASDSDDAGESGGKASAAPVVDYLKNPVPGTVVVFECSRYDFDGEDKTKLARVQKFYGAIPHQIECQRFTAGAARKLALTQSKRTGLQIGEDEVDLLIEILGSDASRIAIEVEKLSLYAGKDRRITAEDVVSLVPNGRATTIFALVAAIGRGDRAGSLDALDILVREGEYLPLALTFLATQFRLALVAKEAGLTNAGMIQSHFTKLGTPMWRARAEQVQQTVAAFSVAKMRKAIQKIFETDRALRDTRPDDRTVMEQFVLGLT